MRGSDAILNCNVTGNPLPQEVFWNRNGSTIKENTKYSLPVRGVLNIKNTTSDDGGIYNCFASNNIGNDNANITLIVLSK